MNAESSNSFHLSINIPLNNYHTDSEHTGYTNHLQGSSLIAECQVPEVEDLPMTALFKGRAIDKTLCTSHYAFLVARPRARTFELLRKATFADPLNTSWSRVIQGTWHVDIEKCAAISQYHNGH